MKKYNKVLIIVLAALLLAACVGSTLAWLAGDKEIECDDMQGSIIAQYFHCGTGAPDDPFVITRPVHYYNLVNLYQRMDGFANKPYYFQLGYDLDGDGETLEVYNYDDSGVRIVDSGNEYSDSLNLACYSGDNALLPIGTSEKPFVGTFDGSGLTIENLNIAASKTIHGVTYKTADVGIFGVVSEPLDEDGNLIPMGYYDDEGRFVPDEDEEGNPMYLMATIANVYYNNVTIDLTGADESEICTANTNVHKSSEEASGQDTVYVGIIAGHIKLSSQVFDVYLNNTTLKGGHAADSHFGYFGCVEDTDGKLVTTLGTLVADIRAKGDDAGFGGSIDMAKMYSRVSNARSNTTRPRYTTAETVIINEVTGEKTVTTTADAQGYYYFDTGDPASGKYYFYNNSGTLSAYCFITGYNKTQTKTVTTYTYKNEYVDAFYITNNSAYLCVNNGAISNNRIAGTSSDTWAFEDGYVYTIYDGTKYYLTADASTRAVSVTTNKAGATQWAKDDTSRSLTCDIGGVMWYLYNDNGWKIDFAKQVYTINDGSHYLAVNASGVFSSVTDAGNATKWAYDGDDLYTMIGTVKYYLNCADSLSITTAKPTVELSYVGGVDYFISYEYNGSTYYLYNDGSSWWVTDQLNQYTFSKGTDYLRVTENGGAYTVSNGTRNTSTKFIFDETDGILYTVINGKIVYLYGDTQLKTTSSKNTADDIKWQYSAEDNRFYYVRGGRTYYLTFLNNEWTVSDGTGLLAFSSNGTYLRHTDDAQISTTGGSQYWNYDESSHYISYTDGGTTYYLRAVLNGGRNLEITTTAGNATAWTFADNELSCSLNVGTTPTTFNLIFDTTSSVWRVADKTKTYYEIKSNSGAHYLSTNNTTIQDKGYAADATWWMLSNYGGNTTVSTYTNNRLYYLSLNNSLNLTNTSTTLYWNANRFRYADQNRTYYLQYNNDWGRSSITNTATGTRYTVSLNEQEFSPTVIRETTTVDTTVTRNSVVVDPESYISLENSHNTDFSKTRMQIVEKTVETGVASGLPSYFPLRTESETDFQVSEKNTGYIVGGGHQTNGDNYVSDIRISRYAINNIGSSYNRNNISYSRLASGSNYLSISESGDSVYNETDASKATYWSFSNVGTNPSGYITTELKGKTYYLTYNNGLKVTDKASDAVSWSYNNRRLYYSNNYIRLNNGAWTTNTTQTNGTQFTFDAGAFSTIKTVDANGNHALTDAQKTTVYKLASQQLLQTLSGEDYVYGLHFMDAAISMDRLITTEEAVILGAHYENYQLPEDSIDFNVVEKGTISFFAGDYYTQAGGNNAFFSLNQIERDENNEIVSIKEIETVYKHKTANKDYVYKYKGEAVSFPEGESASDYEAVFQTSWITNPAGVSSGTNIYYFEIPCNAGEYALGSIEGKTGAYLIYLDIATNGGDAITSIVDEDKSSPIMSFIVDYRDAPDRLGDEENTVFIAAENVPENASADDFSVSISFTNNEDDLEEEFSDGIYTVHIVNKTESDIKFYAYLCDNDGNMATPFKYAYEVYYTNGDHEEQLFPHITLDYWKSIAGFVVPSSGEAREMTTAEYQEYASAEP